jgi:AcrR family transcriptional regulator
MSSSSVYRYFAGKDELIGSAAEESLATTCGVLEDLLAGGRYPARGTP